MVDLEWAKGLARDLLQPSLPLRWRHVQGVAARASSFVDRSHSGQLVTAAWLHDIGYSPTLVDSGFHPLDGARHLRRLRVEETTVNLVAHHSCAQVEAGLRHLELAEEFPRDDSLPHDELCFCDLTTSPDGELVTVETRIAEIRERYGEGHIVCQFIDLAEDDLVATVRRVEAGIAGQPR